MKRCDCFIGSSSKRDSPYPRLSTTEGTEDTKEQSFPCTIHPPRPPCPPWWRGYVRRSRPFSSVRAVRHPIRRTVDDVSEHRETTRPAARSGGGASRARTDRRVDR